MVVQAIARRLPSPKSFWEGQILAISSRASLTDRFCAAPYSVPLRETAVKRSRRNFVRFFGRRT